ncbi:hypothetical protein GMORB2_5899 [Geosmithia morbida]|uniref:Uncharacterized protein n=1 Tax=Geosmithia morbida TaxID=1094350 RepID=A0A9P4YYV1_9HYPO|nr:uncharacterized protein GMORB2_5899 [Geosmithia morbida]KAF4124183.1 hypothetical protein GMORB2_5899 [Geosmithia morbida]
MEVEEAQYLAARILTKLLTDNGINHAFLGGFALRTLEHNRKTDNIDIEVDVLAGEQPRHNLIQLILVSDSRFSVDSLGRLFFTPSGAPELHVLVETLPVGSLNLPKNLATISPGEGPVPILPPGILVLTKIKRLSSIIDSTRPKSVQKAARDTADVMFLLKWLARNEEHIDFMGYEAEIPERLYTATAFVAQT